MYLLGGLGFGLLLEYVNVATNAGYRYGQFWIMFGVAPDNIPLCIGTGWAIIIYTSRLISDALGMPLWSAAALDALLAINIDLSMDVVAYRLHMWHWDWESRGPQYNLLTSQWFGVPYGNFFGWLCVVFFYSSFARLLEKMQMKKPSATLWWKVVIPFLSIIISQVTLYISLFPLSDFLRLFGINSAHRLVALLILFTIMTISGFSKRENTFSANTRLPFITWLVPAWFHCYFFAWLFIGGFHRENAWMTAWSVISLLAGIAIHWALAARFKKKGASVITQHQPASSL
jgi:hypothetical protein